MFLDDTDVQTLRSGRDEQTKNSQARRLCERGQSFDGVFFLHKALSSRLFADSNATRGRRAELQPTGVKAACPERRSRPSLLRHVISIILEISI